MIRREEHLLDLFRRCVRVPLEPEPDGDDIGEATYPDRVKVGEELFFGGGRRFRVLDIVLFDEEDESPFVGLLQVEAA